MRGLGTTLGLGARMAVSGGRAGWLRLLTMAAGVGLGVALLLGVGGVIPAAEHRFDVTAGRSVTGYVAPDAPPLTDGIGSSTSTGLWRGRTLTVFAFDITGSPDTPPPLGLDRIPSPGTTVVSPALAAALAGPHGDELAPRLAGGISRARVGRAGLIGPDELYAITATDLPAPLDQPTAARFDNAPHLGSVLNAETKAAARLGAVLLLVPLLVLIGVSVRLSGASREQRNAAVRLVGATRRQMLGLAAAEAVVAGAIGSVLGAGLFVLLRPGGARLASVRDGLFAADLTPSGNWWLLVLVGVPMLAGLLGAASQRRVVVSPLGVVRQSRPAPAGWWRPATLLLGLAVLVVGYLDRSALAHSTGLLSLVLFGGAGLTLLGLAVVGATLARWTGALLARLSFGPAGQLAGRRLTADPGASGRAVAGTSLAVAVAGFVLAFLPVLQEAHTGYLTSFGLPAGTMVSTRGLEGTDSSAPLLASTRDGLSQVPGVRRVVTLPSVTLLSTDADPAVVNGQAPSSADYRPQDFPLSAVVASCADLAALQQAPLRGCSDDLVQLIVPPGTDTGQLGADVPAGQYLVLDESGQPVDATLDLPGATGPSVVVPYGLLSLLQGSYRLPVGTSLPARATERGTMLLLTDGRAATKEHVRAVLAAGGADQTTALTVPELAEVSNAQAQAYRGATLLGLAVIVVVGGFVMAVSLADGLRERIPAHAAMMAAGVPVRVLRRSVLLQVASPLMASVGLAVAVAALTGGMYQRFAQDDLGSSIALPWASFGLVALVAVVTSLLAGASVLPLVRAARRPGALRVG